MPALPINEWIALLGEFYNSYGYLTVFLGTLGENTAFLGVVLPGNSLSLLGAMYARLGTLNLGWVIFLSTLGTVLGYHVDYLLGRFALARVAKRWSASKPGHRLRLAGRLRLSRMLISRHGGKAILISHLAGHIRSFVALSAGMTRMNYLRFLGYELLAATLWNVCFCLLGYFMATQIDLLRKLVEGMGLVVLAILVVLFLVWRALRVRSKERKRELRRQARRSTKSAIAP
jgi:membrane-associated protein